MLAVTSLAAGVKFDRSSGWRVAGGGREDALQRPKRSGRSGRVPLWVVVGEAGGHRHRAAPGVPATRSQGAGRTPEHCLHPHVRDGEAEGRRVTQLVSGRSKAGARARRWGPRHSCVWPS